MINTFCNNVISVFTHCSSVKKIYVNCEEVWTAEPILDYWYMSWTPTNATGSFKMFSEDREILQDYSGFYSWSGSTSGYIPAGAFNRRGYDDPSTHNTFSTFETNVLSIESYAIAGLSIYLRKVKASQCKYIGSYAFANDHRLSEVSFPVCEYLYACGFHTCSAIRSINLPVCSYIGSGAFYGCTNLRTLTLRYSSVVTLKNDSSIYYYRTFSNTPLARGVGHIYVPSSLVSDYKSNSLWSSLSSVIFPIQ